MNLQFQIKSLLQKSSLIIFLIFTISCKSQSDYSKITTGEIIPPDQDLVYNDASIVNIKGKKIFIQKIELYDETNDLLKAIISKPEGAIEYYRDDLLIDKLLIDYYQISIKKNIKTISEKLISINENIYDVNYKSIDTIIANDKNKFFLITKE